MSDRFAGRSTHYGGMASKYLYPPAAERAFGDNY
jgi:hypothetical protein